LLLNKCLTAFFNEEQYKMKNPDTKHDELKVSLSAALSSGNDEETIITIHETGNTRPGANARAHASFLNNPSTTVSYHYSVDDEEIIQHLPETEDAFHAGDGAGPGNRQSIGIEICVNSDGDFQAAIDRAAALTADICKRRGIPLENIRQHFNWSGKNCPQNIRAGRPHGWDVFMEKVAEAFIAALTPQKPQTPSKWAKAAWTWGMDNKITDGTNPQAHPTREQVVQQLFNFYRLMNGIPIK
jgi:N-acetylmuramoyl-L-alanine amidase CwlA